MDAPKAPDDNLLYRAWLLGRCERNGRVRRACLERCAHDLIFYVDSFVYQHNPDRVDDEVGPFVTYPFQERALVRTEHRLLVERGDAWWEKSRKIGATWKALILFDRQALFHRYRKFLCVSHTAEAVDRSNDPDSLFWKIQFMHDHLPEWITRGVEKQKMRFHFPWSKSSITGAASTGRSGVGGRATAVFLDELAKQESAHEILSQTRDTGPRLGVSTHYGVGTAFYEKVRQPDVWKIQMHWSEHPAFNAGLYRCHPDRPRQDRIEIVDRSYSFPPDYPFVRDGDPTGGPYPGLRSVWYDKEDAERGSRRDMRMHLDIDPEGSGNQFFDQGVIRGLVRECARPPAWEGDLEYDPERGKPESLVPRAGGPLRLWVLPDVRGKVPVGVYGAGADVAGGTGCTPSCFAVGNARLGQLVGTYATPRLTPKEFAPVCAALGWLFQDEHGQPALFGWEADGGVGEAFGQTFMDLHYPRVGYDETRMSLGGYRGLSDKPGIYLAGAERKRVFLEDYRIALTTRRLVVPDALTLEDGLAFEYTKGDRKVVHSGEKLADDPSQARENHGDRTVAAMIMLNMMKRLGGPEPVAPPVPAVAPGSLQFRRLLAEAGRVPSHMRGLG